MLCSVLVVLISANRPSLLTPTSHANYFPHWMAGPLGGLLPSLTRQLDDAEVPVLRCDRADVRQLRAGAALRAAAAHTLGGRGDRGGARVFFLSPPLALTDIFNYVNYGRMEVVHQLNPYTTIPILEPHNDPSYALSNWHQLLSPYGPLFTILTFAFVPLGVAATLWAMKALLAAASLGTIFLVWKCARLLGREPVAAIVLVGLNPVVLVWGLGGDHNDFLMVFFIVLGFYLLLLRARTRSRRAGRRWRGRGRTLERRSAWRPPARLAAAALGDRDLRRRGVRRRDRRSRPRAAF